MSIHRLKPKFVDTVKADGMYPDGGGLYLQIRGNARSWIFRFAILVDGQYRDRQMGLGPLHTIGLAKARELARDKREQRLNDVDPIDARNAERLDQKLAKAKDITFRHCAEKWMAKQDIEWTPYTSMTARRRFELHVYPKLGDLPIAKLDRDKSPHAVELVLSVLEPIWKSKVTTAELIRMHIESVLDWAHAAQHIGPGNAASLKGPLGNLLPKQKTFHRVNHHRALPHQEIGQFMAVLRARADESRHAKGIRRPVTAELIEFLILTAVRKDQAVMVRWDDIDPVNKIWSCAEHKTKKKTGEDHIIPLSDAAMAVYHRMKEIHEERGIKNEFIFPGTRSGRKGHMSKTGVNAFLHRGLKRTDVSIHGFRTTFKTWAVETGQNEESSEMALAHVVGNATRNVYARNAKKIEPRRKMMEEWAAFCSRTEPLDAKILPMRAKKGEKA
jgi:integrase